MAGATHYDTLGVAKDADPEAIKKAWRRKASKAHTDRDGGNHGQMVALNRAYEVLSDTEKRARYDQTGEDGPVPSLDSKATDAVMQIVIAMIDQAPDHEDVIALARRHMERATANFRTKRADAERQAEKLEKKRKRLTHKGKKVERNFLDDLLTQRIGQIRQSFAGIDEAISVFTRGLELLEDYAYKADSPPQSNVFSSALAGVYAQQQQPQSGFWTVGKMKTMLVPLERPAFLNAVEKAARAYVISELGDDPRIAEEGAALHELAKALGLVQARHS